MDLVAFTCPSCGESIDIQARQCQHCGIDLALAAGLAERVLATSTLPVAGVPLAPEVLVPRFGDYLLEKGLISVVDLQRALDHQQKLHVSGQPRLLGQVLLDLKLINREVLDQVIAEQILKLQDALQQSNRRLEQRVQERTIELQRALSRLTELNQLKSNFISNISHELRTPLTHLRGYLGLLMDQSLGPLTEEQKEAFDVLCRAEARLEQLIEDLIQFSLASRGELTLNMTPVSIADIIKVVVARSVKIARARKVVLDVALRKPLPLVKADGEKVSWVLLQLLDNAIKFTPQNGSVTVDAEREGSIVTIGVTDTGIGIAPERVNEIFEPFHQLDSSDTRKFGGVGLGLTLVRRIVEAHGSAIRVQSGVGQGSRFEFSLPVVQERNV